MKRIFKRLVIIVAEVIMLFAFSVSAFAQTGFEFPEHPHCILQQRIDVGEEYTGFVDGASEGRKYYSNNEEVLEVKEDGTILALSEGSAVIAEIDIDGELRYYYGFFVSEPFIPEESLSVDDATDFDTIFDNDYDYDEDEDEDEDDEEFHIMMIIGPALIVLLVGLLLAEIFYIFVTAPKFGMSRFWALAPIVGNVFGLIVFLMLKTAAKQNNQVSKNVIVCPTCNGKHPYGTEVCSICGTKLGN